MSKIMTNNTIVRFTVIFVVLSFVLNYFLIYKVSIIHAILVSAVSSLFILIVLIVKRKWDLKQDKEFRK